MSVQRQDQTGWPYDPAEKTKDTVNHPSHYKTSAGIEAIDVIEAFGLNFHRGNTVKYILRAGKKQNEVEDLRKAIWYLTREVERLTKGE